MDVSLIFTYLAVVISFGFLYYSWCFGYWKRKNVATLPPNLFFGNLTDVIFGKVGFSNIFEKTYNELKTKGYAGYYMLAKPIIVIMDPKLIDAVLVTDFSHFTDRPIFTNKKFDPLSSNLFSMKGQEWKDMRSVLSPAFTTNKLKVIMEYFLAVGSNLKTVMDDICKNSKVVDIKDISNKYIVDVIATSFLGVECNTLLNRDLDFAELLSKTIRGSLITNLRVFASFLFSPLLILLGGRMIDKESADFFIKVTKQTVEYRENNHVIKKDLMQLLIQLRNNIDIAKSDNIDLSKDKSDKQEKLLSIEEIAAHVFTFYAAGSESSSSAVAFCLFELIQNPETKTKLIEEINRVLANHNGEITYEALMEMTYMDMCIKETNRIYPAVPFLSRHCTKDFVIPETDVIVKKGIVVQIPILQIHRDPDYFPNPKQFDPERFSLQNRSKIQPNTYLPFGGGPHICIGMRLANMKVKIALTILLKNYNFTLNSRTKVPLEVNDKEIFLGIKNGIWLNVEKNQ